MGLGFGSFGDALDTVGQVASPAYAVYRHRNQIKSELGLDPADTSNTAAAIKGQGDFGSKLQEQYGNLANGQAPVIAQAERPYTERLTGTIVGSAPQVHAQQIAAPGAIGAAQVGPIARVNAQGISAPNLGQALQAGGYGAATNRIQRPTGLDGQLGSAYGMLESAARGDAPSVAQGQMRQGLDEAIGAQLGAAASSRGRNIGLAQRGAMMMGARMQQKGVNDAAMLRASEMAHARDAYTNALQAGRGQDIGMATTDASNATQTALHNSSLATEISKYNAGVVNDRTLQQAQIGLDAGKFNSSQNFAAQSANQGVDQASALANAGYQQDANRFNTSTGLDVAKTNAANNLTASQASADLLQKGQFKNADIDMAVQGKNAEFVNSLGLEMAKLGVQVNTANADALLKSRGLDDNRAASLAQAINQSYSNQLSGGMAITNASAAQNAKKLGLVSGILDTGAKAFAGGA